MAVLPNMKVDCFFYLKKQKHVGDVFCTLIKQIIKDPSAVDRMMLRKKKWLKTLTRLATALKEKDNRISELEEKIQSLEVQRTLEGNHEAI